MTSDLTFPKRFDTNTDNKTTVEFREIPLTRGYVALVSPEDHERVSAHKWCANVTAIGPYAFRRQDGKAVYLHRWLLGVTDPDVLVDHRDRNTLDYRRHNLRQSSRSQNNCNRTSKGTKHGFTGVDRAPDGAYFGRVTLHRRTYYTDRFSSPVLAAIARDQLCRKLHGEYAVTNFPAKGGENSACISTH